MSAQKMTETDRVSSAGGTTQSEIPTLTVC